MPYELVARKLIESQVYRLFTFQEVHESLDGA